MDIELADVIEACAFDEYDVDSATSGLCGTFALAVKSAFPEVHLAVVCDNDEFGQPDRASDGDLYWRHVVAVLEGELFDIDGKVELEHLVENYCWRNENGTGGSLVPLSLPEMEKLLDDGKSYDVTRFREWADRLSMSRASLHDLVSASRSTGSTCISHRP